MFIPMFPTVQFQLLSIPGLDSITPETVASFLATVFAFYMAARRGFAAAGTLSNVPPSQPQLPPPPQLAQLTATLDHVLARIERIDERINNLDRRADRTREDVNRIQRRLQRMDLQMRTSQEFEMPDSGERDDDESGEIDGHA